MCTGVLPPQVRLLDLPRFSADVLESKSCGGSLLTRPTRTCIPRTLTYNLPPPFSMAGSFSLPESILGLQQRGFPPKDGKNSIWLLSEALGMHESTPQAELDSEWFPGFCWFPPAGQTQHGFKSRSKPITCFSLFYPKPSLCAPQTYHRSLTPKRLPGHTP